MNSSYALCAACEAVQTCQGWLDRARQSMRRWLVSISYRFSYYDDVAEKCHEKARWRTTLGKRFAHVPVGAYALVRVIRGPLVQWSRLADAVHASSSSFHARLLSLMGVPSLRTMAVRRRTPAITITFRGRSS